MSKLNLAELFALTVLILEGKHIAAFLAVQIHSQNMATN
jgi:hypothetical protein